MLESGQENDKQPLWRKDFNNFLNDTPGTLRVAVQALSSGEFEHRYDYLELHDISTDDWCRVLDNLMGAFIGLIKENPQISSGLNNDLKEMISLKPQSLELFKTKLHFFKAAGVPREKMKAYLSEPGSDGVLSTEHSKILRELYDGYIN